MLDLDHDTAGIVVLGNPQPYTFLGDNNYTGDLSKYGYIETEEIASAIFAVYG